MVCEFYGSNGNGFGNIWWTDNPIYFSSIDYQWECKRRLTWSPKRMDSTNQKWLPPDARASRDVFHARLPLKVMVKLYNGSIFVITETQIDIQRQVT